MAVFTDLENITFHANKLASVLAHQEFLSCCLSLGIIPKGLTLKLPLSGMSPLIRQRLSIFGYTASLDMLKVMLSQLYHVVNYHRSLLFKSCNRLNQTIDTTSVDSILHRANIRLQLHRRKLLLKLNDLCLRYLSLGLSLPFTLVPITPPLYSDRPSLQQLFDLPPPVPVIPKLPRRQSPPVVRGSNAYDKSTRVLNLSDRQLDAVESDVLAKGLTFSPTPRVDPARLVTDAVAFTKSLRWHYFWKNNPPAENDAQPHPALKKFIPPTSNEPPPLNQNHPLEVYIDRVLTSIASPDFINSLRPRSNLSVEEFRALHRLKNDRSIIVLPADKGTTTVIQNIGDYRKEASRQLQSTTYRRLDHDPTLRYLNKIKNFIITHGPQEGLTEQAMGLLLPSHPRTSHLYLLPKIHKEGCPGRPIVASYNSPTERISAYVDFYLQPLVKDLPSYIRDSYDFLDKLRSLDIQSFNGIILVTVDVVSLYTNILHNEGLAALRRYLNLRPPPHSPSTSFLLELAELVLTSNVFRFEQDYYLQTEGTAMGTRMAPPYANLFMGALEEDFLNSQPLKPLCWKRFIDDIFFVWDHGEESLDEFIRTLNSRYSVKFTCNRSTSSITFLDLDIEVEATGFKTSIHVKETNKQEYLHYTSCHPYHMKKSIPYSLSLRAHRISSNLEDLDVYLKNLRSAFDKRGYPDRLLHKQILPANALPPNRPEKTVSPVNLSTTFFPGLHKLKYFLSSNFHLLTSNPATQDLLPCSPKVVFKRPPNLRDLLVKTKPSNEVIRLPKGSHPCNVPRCKTCPIITPTLRFVSPVTQLPLQIRNRSNCVSSNTVYALLCKFCDAFYIGESTTILRLRINNHRCSVSSKNPNLSIPQHAAVHNKSFNDCFNVTILEDFPPAVPESRLRSAEAAYIWLTGALEPPGLNRKH